MNRYLRMGLRRQTEPRPGAPLKGVPDDPHLLGEGSPVLDSVYDEIEAELEATAPDAPPNADDEDDDLTLHSVTSRAWCGERAEYVPVRWQQRTVQVSRAKVRRFG